MSRMKLLSVGSPARGRQRDRLMNEDGPMSNMRGIALTRDED